MVLSYLVILTDQGRIQRGAQGARAPPLISRVVIFQLNNFL